MAKFPGDLESQYLRAMTRFMNSLNRQYMLMVRQLLIEGDEEFRNNSIKRNAFDFNKFRNKLIGLREKIEKSSLFKDVFKSMANVFSRVDRKITSNITRVFKKQKFPIPIEVLKVDSQALQSAVSKNVALIQALQDGQVTALENAIMDAVKGGSKFSVVIEEVEKQSNRGRAEAEMVARDQVAKTYASINEERSQAVGFPGYLWQATGGKQGDGKTRDTHAALHDTFHLWADPPTIQGEGATPSRALHPGEDFNCRCIAVPAFQPE